jgi:RNA polymerase sigma-70 factor (ECF subfamily)
LSGDDDLITRAKVGDEAAWRQLYIKHAARLSVWLRTIPNPDTTSGHEDLAADAWVVAAERIQDFHGSSGEFAGWLFGIGRNLALNARRRSLRRATAPYAVPPDGYAPVVVAPELEVAAEDWVQRLLRQLPVRERQVVTCLDVLGLDVRSTATALGVTATSVRVAHHRALGRLRRLADD